MTLSAEQIERIRSTDTPHRHMAKEIGVGWLTVRSIRRGYYHATVPPQAINENAEWRVIPGFPTHEVSDQGDVRRVGADKTIRKRTNSWGYFEVTLSVGGKAYPKRVHRLVAAAFVPCPEGATEVDHIDGGKKNNAASNLEWVRKRTNYERARDAGKYTSAVLCPWQKVTPEAEIALREGADKDTCPSELAERYGVTRQHIMKLRRGKSRRARKTSTDLE